MPAEESTPIPPVVPEAQQNPTEKPHAPTTEEKAEIRQVLRKKKVVWIFQPSQRNGTALMKMRAMETAQAAYSNSICCLESGRN